MPWFLCKSKYPEYKVMVYAKAVFRLIPSEKANGTNDSSSQFPISTPEGKNKGNYIKCEAANSEKP